MQEQEKKVYTREHSVDFVMKAGWLAIAKMYNTIGSAYQITHSSGFVLINIDGHDGIPATKIAPLMGMETRSLTRMLKTLESDGMIYKVSDPLDKRKTLIHLTPKGKEKSDIAKQGIRSFNTQLREIIPEKDMETFFSVVKKVREVVELNLMSNDIFELVLEEAAKKKSGNK
jgi:DNA-binding MarR family transcriptional regulator